ncbi:hypothetical protein HII31_00254 [Pseudocercospora fuligena]|uniref:Cyclase n=1 Tax=Pseudocercospora fuligena TaxID=685502 RepID=A0A8H6VTS5_9PEZI|nr:hypothetical protein HII31_00254 [Pseudocercospora fuligena]
MATCSKPSNTDMAPSALNENTERARDDNDLSCNTAKPVQQRRKNVSFSSLPLQPEHPPFSAWGLWGKQDELGTLNLITPKAVAAASAEVVLGLTIPLNLSLTALARPMNPARKPCCHHINVKGHANDDRVDFDTQGSSHWDGLRHYPYQSTLQYYNGVQQDQISTNSPTLGIQNVARKGIATRGVLLDWARYAEDEGIDYSPFERHSIPLWQLKEVAARQHVEFRGGDVLIIRTGWIKKYRALTLAEQLALPDRPVRASCGVEASEEVMQWHWENAFSAVVSDTVAYEVWPSPRPCGVSLHEVFLSGWGMMIGENWDLEQLSQECRKYNRYSFFLTSMPVHIPGGVASPPGAMAIL